MTMACCTYYIFCHADTCGCIDMAVRIGRISKAVFHEGILEEERQQKQVMTTDWASKSPPNHHDRQVRVP